MFRISHYLQELLHPTPLPQTPRRPSGPVVIWNLIRRCNLTCQHCYSISADTDFKGELRTEEVFTVLQDLKQFGVPAIILSGGEPLLRPDLFTIATRAKQLGFYVGLSTNGTLITQDNIKALAAVGFDYVGISLDGIGATHDRFRRKTGAFTASLDGIAQCQQQGIRVGLRFTMTQDNAAELPLLLQLMAEQQIDKFYFSHLNYAGRGNRNRKRDVEWHTTRWAMDLLFEAALQAIEQGRDQTWVSGNNDADGVYLWRWAQQRFSPAQTAHLYAKLQHWGGNRSGIDIANIDNLGNVHPDTFWWHHTIGNVRQRPFSAIWTDTCDPLMAGLKSQPRPLEGRCGRCPQVRICGGNTRVRAYQLTGNPWAEDPACYLTDTELGLRNEAADAVAEAVA